MSAGEVELPHSCGCKCSEFYEELALLRMFYEGLAETVDAHHFEIVRLNHLTGVLPCSALGADQCNHGDLVALTHRFDAAVDAFLTSEQHAQLDRIEREQTEKAAEKTFNDRLNEVHIKHMQSIEAVERAHKYQMAAVQQRLNFVTSRLEECQVFGLTALTDKLEQAASGSGYSCMPESLPADMCTSFLSENDVENAHSELSCSPCARGDSKSRDFQVLWKITNDLLIKLLDRINEGDDVERTSKCVADLAILQSQKEGTHEVAE